MDALVNPNRRMMLGTGGQLDYLILTDRGDTGLGIKVLMCGGPKSGVTLAFRVRVALLPSAPKKGQMIDWKELWSELKWENVSYQRASTALLCPSGLFFWQIKELRERFPKMIHSLLGFLTERIGEFDTEDATKYIHEIVDPILDQMEQHANVCLQTEADGSTVMYAAQVQDLVHEDKPGAAQPKSFQPKIVGGTDYGGPIKHVKHSGVTVDDDEDDLEEED